MDETDSTTISTAYLLLCHRDAALVDRLVTKLLRESGRCGVFVHVDAKSPERAAIERRLAGRARVRVIADPVALWWGGASAIDATLTLIRAAVADGPYARFVLLQGADYPLRSGREIETFFATHRDVEFLRACNSTTSSLPHIAYRSRHRLYFDRPNAVKKLFNRLSLSSGIRTKRRCVTVRGRDWPIYWGCAQWALTRACIDMILEIADDRALLRYFASTFPADETFFHTIVHNSRFSTRTSHHGPEADVTDMMDLKNLTYFEYPTTIRTFVETDFDVLTQLAGYLFVRKTTSQDSGPLLDQLDRLHIA